MSHVATVADKNLPGLSIAFNRAAFLELLAENLPECRDGLELLDARIIDVQYSPGSNAQVLWKVNVQDPESGRTCRQLVSAKVLRKDEPAPAEPAELIERYAQMRDGKHMTREMPIRTPWLSVPRADLLVHAFPLDPALPSLIDVADPMAMKESLHRLWRPRRVRVRRVRVETLSYTPESRAALKYEVLSEDKDTGLPALRHFVGKLHARRSAARLFAGHWAVWRRTSGRVSIAPPVGYLGVQRLSLQEFVSGVRLSDLAGPGNFMGQIRAAARSIAAVHSLRLPLLTERGLDREMAVVNRWVSVLSGLRPAHAARLQRIGSRLQRELAQRMRLTGTVHGDFHLANMLADDYGITLIDWDQVAHGDPMIDVGRALASLRVTSLRVHGTLRGFAEAEEGFLRAYLDQTNDDERRARLFEAVSLLIAAAAPFRLQREGWEDGAEQMLDEVERTLQLSANGPRLAVAASVEKSEIPFSERADWALDRVYAQALLLPIVHESYGSDIEVTETLPTLVERSHDRLCVRWNLKGYKGPDDWSADLGGVGFADDSGRGRLRRVMMTGEALAAQPKALQVPRVLGHLGPISMQVFISPEGQSLLELLGSADEAAAIDKLSTALAEFHLLNVDLGKERECSRDVRSAGRRVERLNAAGHPEANSAREVFDRIASTIATFLPRRVPVVTGIRLRELRIRTGGVGIVLVEDVVMTEPLLAAGDLCAQLRIHALKRGIPASAADFFQSTYLSASGDDKRALDVFEALALLRRACRRGVRDCQDQLVAPIIEAASRRVGWCD